MDEFSLINAIKQRSYRQASLQRGIGDDAAVFKNITHDTVVAMDTFVEGIHFTDKTMNQKQIGYRTLAANFSDLAAMGALPMFYLVSIVIPPSWCEEEVQAIYRGMNDLAASYQADLIGGDTVSGEELTISITVIGKVEQNKARYRSHAQPGDVVFVTGTLGDSQAGLHILQKNDKVQGHDYFIQRHQMPTPRIHFANDLKHVNRVALNDVSDGIGNELHEIAEASQVTIEIKDEQIPTHSNFKHFPKELQEKWKYFGGEDFELVGSVSEKDWPIVQEAAKKWKLPITAIGNVIMKKENSVYLIKNSKKYPLGKDGYTHLR